MASLHRLQWIDERIRHRAFPNIGQMVERFEISRRQALRDIEYLRDSLGAPIAYDAKRKGYVYTDESFAVPTQLVTDDQRQLLACLSSHYEVLAAHDCRTSEVFGAIARLLVRLSGQDKVVTNPKFKVKDGVVPFYAIMQPEGGLPSPIPPSLHSFYRGHNNLQQHVFEFYDSHDFIPSLLASGYTFRIVHPQWLKQKLVRYLEQIREANIG